MRLRSGAVLLLVVAFFFLSSSPLVRAQEEVIDGQLTIKKVEVDQFPIVVAQISASDENGRNLGDLSNLMLQENGQEIETFQIEPLDLGVGLVFVIDANETINETDESGGLTRLEKVRDSIIRYANFFMDPLPNDEVSILIPDGQGGIPLDKNGMRYQNEVINAINFYQPDQFEEPPLNRMLEQAIDQAQSNPDDGRFRGIVLFTDGGQLDETLDYKSITNKALEAGVPIFALLLGSRADEEEIASLEALTIPTGGQFTHMPEVEDADSLFQLIEERSTQQQISYRSSINTSGSHSLVVSTGEAEDKIDFEVMVSPPSVSITVDNNRPIRRVGTKPSTPLDLMEPFVQPLVAQVIWPDGQPRKLVDAKLLINGEEVALEAPVLGDDGVLAFEWDLRRIDEGLYDIQIEVTDELGLGGISEKLPLAVEIDRPPEPIPTMTVAPAPTQLPPEPVIIEPIELQDNFVLLGAGLFFLALFGLMALLFIIVFARRSRAAKIAAVPAAGSVSTAGGIRQPGWAPAVNLASTAGPGVMDPNVTYIIPPEFAISDLGKAYIEVLEHAPEHATIIPITGSNIALGRDPKVVQVPFNDRSVSRLHARIMESDGVYRIYDEGSSSGTYVNFERIGLAPRILNDDDDLHFGRVHLKFHITPPSEEAPETEIYNQDRL
jgi:hypothetical protein